ncbi:MAG: transposase [Kofleriaceae bacterium]
MRDGFTSAQLVASLADIRLMARNARRNVPGGIYHLISRFADHRWFLRDDEERETYLRMFAYGLGETDWRCLGYALMSSHLHHAMIAGRMPMESLTKRVNSQFAHWLNRRHGRIGSVFADRVKDIGFSPSRAAWLLAYIHNNPVRAGVVKRARDSTWTSHRAYCGLTRVPPWLHVEQGLQLTGFCDSSGFDAWVDETPGESRDLLFEQLRREARRRGAVVLATPQVDRDAALVPLVAAPFAHLRPDPRGVISCVAGITGIDVALICSRRRLLPIRSARTIVVTACLALGLTKSEIAYALGMSAQGVHYASQRTPTNRERAVIELVIDQVALALRQRSAG